METQFDATQIAQTVIAVILGLAAVLSALAIIVKYSKTVTGWFDAWRVTSCPNHGMTCNNLGGLIVFYCAFSQTRGYIPPFEKVWLDSVMKDYDETQQNHGVHAVYDEACKLPTHAQKTRRCTDKE